MPPLTQDPTPGLCLQLLARWRLDASVAVGSSVPARGRDRAGHITSAICGAGRRLGRIDMLSFLQFLGSHARSIRFGPI